MRNTSTQRWDVSPKLDTAWEVVELRNLSSYFAVDFSQATLTRNMSKALDRGKEITPQGIMIVSIKHLIPQAMPFLSMQA